MLTRKISLFIIYVISMMTYSGFTAMAQGVALGYVNNDPELKPGMIVQLSEDGKSGEGSKVERASIDKQESIIGVATNPDDPTLVIASGGDRVYVQSNGEVDAYVSNINGEVSEGDLLTLSPVKGILMKHIGSGVIMGTALSNFNSANATSYSIDGGDSDLTSVLVGKIRVNLDAGTFANLNQGETSTLGQIGKSITGKDVGDLRVLIGIIIFVLIMVAEAGIIYAAVSSSITAIGRNPLATSAIKRELVRVTGIALIVLVIGLGSIYAILIL